MTTRSASALRRVAPSLAVGALVVALDQATKTLMRRNLDLYEAWPADWEWITLRHIHNTGAAFGIFQGGSDWLVFVALGIVGGVIALLLTLPDQTRWHRLALGLVLGGAIGNLIDRVLQGYVTDFIDPTHYPAFNLADSGVVIGVGLLLLLSLLEQPAHDTAVREESRSAEARP